MGTECWGRGVGRPFRQLLRSPGGVIEAAHLPLRNLGPLVRSLSHDFGVRAGFSMDSRAQTPGGRDSVAAQLQGTWFLPTPLSRV